jgi:glycine oxidase
MKVVVIGAGVAGLSIGWRLAQSGCKVVILERASPGRAATWASAGMIAATMEGSHGAEALAEYGHYSARLWPSFAAEIEQASGRSISYRRDGTLMVSLSGSNASSDPNPSGVSALSSEEARDLEPMLASGIAGALFAPDDAQVDNRALGIALALAVVAAGGTVQVNEAVVRLEMAGANLVGARTPFGLYGADAFIIAAGAWSNELKGLPPDLMPPVSPVKGEMIALARPSGAALPTRLVWGNDVYLVPRHDRLLVGATMSRDGFDTAPTEAARTWLRERAIALMPALKDWAISEHWAGLRPGTPDDLPVIGETAIPGLFIASGQYRNGILLAPAIAEALRSLVLEHRQPPEIQAFHPNRFARPGLAGGDGVG